MIHETAKNKPSQLRRAVELVYRAVDRLLVSRLVGQFFGWLSVCSAELPKVPSRPEVLSSGCLALDSRTLRLLLLQAF